MKEISSQDYESLCLHLEAAASALRRQATNNHQTNVACRLIGIAKKLNRKGGIYTK